jgi:Holliday junction resolvase RusA-like endonuclease
MPVDRIYAEILGKPIAKERPRTVKIKGRSVTYTPQKTKLAEKVIAWEIMAQNPGLEVDGESLFELFMEFYLTTKTRVDGDNLQKLCMDSANGIIWADDSQVVKWHGTLFRSQKVGKTVIEVRKLDIK